MAKQKQVLNAALKALLAGAETSAAIKIPATFISELASLSDDKQKVLAEFSQEQFNALLTQSELATLNAADAAATSKRIEHFLHEYYKKQAGTSVPPSRPLDSITYIPYPPNDYFTGRKDQLKELSGTLKHDTSAIITQAIRGLGGVGKTQIALRYAYKFQNRYDSIIWLRADTEQTITTDLEQIMQRLNLPAAKLEQNRANLIRWLTEHKKWLLVFDNADDPRRITPYLPPQGTGHILINLPRNGLPGYTQRPDSPYRQDDRTGSSRLPSQTHQL